MIAGDDPAEFRAVLEAIASRVPAAQGRRPGHLRAGGGSSQSKVPLLADRPPRDGRTTTYICEHFTCREPVLGVEGVEAALGQQAAR